jgi:hypothetical protein
MLKKFWDWYERHYTLAVGIAAGLFALQLVHLYWLGANVIASRLFGESFFDPSGIWKFFILLVDYTEVPAIIATSLVYIAEFRREKTWKPLVYLALLNSQWLHLFWITDEFVVGQFADPVAIPVWLAWVAILIDYLELPVIADTLRKFFASLNRGNVRQAFEEIKNAD